MGTGLDLEGTLFQPSAGFVPGRVLGPGVTAVSKTNGDEYYGENKTE